MSAIDKVSRTYPPTLCESPRSWCTPQRAMPSVMGTETLGRQCHVGSLAAGEIVYRQRLRFPLGLALIKEHAATFGDISDDQNAVYF